MGKIVLLIDGRWLTVSFKTKILKRQKESHHTAQKHINFKRIEYISNHHKHLNDLHDNMLKLHVRPVSWK